MIQTQPNQVPAFAKSERVVLRLRDDQVQTYAWDEAGELMHAGPRPLPKRGVTAGTLRRWAREWRRWALAGAPADCPTGVTARTKRHARWAVEYADGRVLDLRHPTREVLP